MINFTSGLIKVGKNYYNPDKIKKFGPSSTTVNKTDIYFGPEFERLDTINIRPDQFADAFIKTQTTGEMVSIGEIC